MRNIILFVLLQTQAAIASADILAMMKVDGQTNQMMTPQQPSRWEFKYTDTLTNGPVHHFMKMHEKLNHMIVVSRDLKDLSHIHPDYNERTHLFSVTVNQSTSDSDNQDLLQCVKRSGDHFVFATTMPMPDEVMMTHRFTVKATGPAPVVEKLIPDLNSHTDTVTKYFTDRGEVAEWGALLKVDLKIVLFKGCINWVPRFHAQFSVYDPTTQNYKPATDFVNWLGMGAHAVLVSESGVTVEEKIFYHLHSFMPILTPGEFKFPFDDPRRGLPNGIYKIWFQAKHRGVILKIPFVINFDPPPYQRPLMGEVSLCAI
ncbi:MAG: hypothetical protein AB7F59_13535 [Bdellovibrionales bacterium]